MTIGRRLLAAAGAIGITVAAGLAGAGTADAAADCGTGQLCVWMSTDPGTVRSVVVPPVRPQCALVGFGAMTPAVRLPAGASIGSFPFLVQGVAR